MPVQLLADDMFATIYLKISSLQFIADDMVATIYLKISSLQFIALIPFKYSIHLYYVRLK